MPDHRFTPNHFLRSLPVRWVVFASFLIVLSAAVLSFYAVYLKQLHQHRNSVLYSEISNNVSIAGILRDDLGEGDHANLQEILRYLYTARPASQYYLIDLAGQIHFSSTTALPLHPPSAEEIQSIPSLKSTTAWFGERHLRSLIWIGPSKSSNSLLLYVESDQQSDNRIFQRRFTESVFPIAAITLVVCGLVFATLWWLVVNPLQFIQGQLQHTLTGQPIHITGGAALSEINNLTGGMNHLIQQITTQQEELKRWNERLEETIVRRTAELDRTYKEAHKRSIQIEIFNQIILATSTAAEESDLVEQVRYQIQRLTGAPHAGVRLGTAYADDNLPLAVATDLERLSHDSVATIVEDWQELGQYHEFSGEALAHIERLNIHSSLSLPIQTANQQLGAIHLAVEQPRAWPAEDIRFLETICRQVAITAERLGLFRDTLRRSERMEILIEQERFLSAAHSREEAYTAIGEGSVAILQADRAVVFSMEANHVTGIAWAFNFPEKLELDLTGFDRMEQSLSELEDGKPLTIENFDQDTSHNFICQMAQHGDFQSAVYWPVRREGNTIAVIAAFFFEPRARTTAENEIALTFTRHAALSLHNARLYEELDQNVREMNALYQALEPFFTPGSDIPTLAEQIVQAVSEEFSSAHCSLFLLNSAARQLEIAAQAGELISNFDTLDLFGDGITAAAGRAGQTLYAPDVSTDPHYLAALPTTRSELALPLKFGEQVIGVLNLESSEIDGFTPASQQILSSFCERAALGFENTRLLQSARQHARQMSILNEINRIALRTDQAETIFPNLTRLMAELFNADACHITHWNETLQTAEASAAFGTHQEAFFKMDPSRATSPSMTQLLMERKRPIVMEKANENTRINPVIGQSMPLRSVLGLPIMAGDFRYGAVMIGFDTDHHFTLEEIELGEQVAGQLSLTIDRLRSLATAEQRAKEAESLYTATTILSSSLDQVELLKRLLQSALQAIPAGQFAAVHLAEEATGLLTPAAVLGVTEPETPERLLVSAMNATRSQQPLLIQRFDPADDGPRGSAIIAPIVHEEAVLGTLLIHSPAADQFAQTDLHVLIGLSNAAAAALRRAQLHEQIRTLAVTDPLTGLFNRRGLYEPGRRMVELARRRRRPLSAILIDMDFFKRVNDRYGHSTGDEVLQVLAQRLRENLRDSDTLCRYGGEEFIALLPESDTESALIVAERLKTEVAQPVILSHTGDSILVTASIGVAEIDDSCESLEDLVDRADSAAYVAKNMGRNQVRVWDHTLSQNVRNTH